MSDLELENISEVGNGKLHKFVNYVPIIPLSLVTPGRLWYTMSDTRSKRPRAFGRRGGDRHPVACELLLEIDIRALIMVRRFFNSTILMTVN